MKKAQSLPFPQKDLVELILVSLERFSSKKETRVVNPADPTAVEVMDCVVGLWYGFSPDPDDDFPFSTGQVLPENVHVHVVSSFGTEITLKTSTGKFTGYFDPSEGKGGKWIRADLGFFEVLRRVVIEGEKKLDLPQNEIEEGRGA
jgi:hypothetical protein